MRITDITITPVAFRDPPLLNSAGVHEPWALRSIIEVHTDEGISGLGESYGDIGHLARLEQVAPALVGLDVHQLNAMHAKVAEVLGGKSGDDRHGLTGTLTAEGTVDRVFSPFEVATWDIRGKALGRPVSDLLGGAVRDAVPYSAYLFYKWAAHPGQEPDTTEEVVVRVGGRRAGAVALGQRDRSRRRDPRRRGDDRPLRPRDPRPVRPAGAARLARPAWPAQAAGSRAPLGPVTGRGERGEASASPRG